MAENLRVVKSPRVKEPFYMKTAYAIGYIAYYVHEVIISIWFRLLVTIVILYLLMHFTGISLTVARHGEVLFTLR